MKYTCVSFIIILLLVHSGFSQDKAKKVELEISMGLSGVNPSTIYPRSAGIGELIHQYAQQYGLNDSADGELKEIKMSIPFNISLNYRLEEKLFLKAGIDYCFSKALSSQKTFQVAWEDFNENYDYILTDKISYLMPHIGLAYMPGAFGLHGAVGMGFARFTHIEDLEYSEPGYGYDTSDTFKVKGTGIGVILGVKYKIPLGKKTSGKPVHAFVKLESVLLKVNTLSGNKTRAAVDANGQRVSDTEEGTLYGFEWSPYGKQWVEFWDIYETPPSNDPAMRNFQKMSLNLSGIRLMIGISF
jgi:hypothetical protein